MYAHVFVILVYMPTYYMYVYIGMICKSYILVSPHVHFCVQYVTYIFMLAVQ